LSDLITEGITRKTGSAPFPDTSAPLPQAESDASDVVRVDNPIAGATDEERVRNSVSELRKQRERDGGEIADIGKRDIVQVHYDGREHENKTLRQVTRDYSDWQRMQKADARAAVEIFGGNPEEVIERARDPNFIRQIDPSLTPAEAQHFARTGEMPPMPIGVADERRGLAERLRDSEPVLGRPAHEALNLRETTRQTGNFRELLAAEMSRQQMADAEAVNLALEQQQAKPTEAPQQSVQQAQRAPAPQQQPDPLARERQRLAFEAQAHAALRQSSIEEINAMSAAEQIIAAFPELKSEAAVRDAYARNPQRFQQLQQAAQALQNCQAQFQRANEARSVREAQLQQAENEHINRVYRQYSKANDDAFAARTPEMQNPAKAQELRAATRQMMHDVGFSEDEINNAWAGKTGVPLRDHRVQQLLADGARWRMAQAKAKNVTRASVPPVQRPGVARPRGTEGEADIGRLERALEGASGERAALQAATKLTQARRRAGML
jgi:hypothetical protein